MTRLQNELEWPKCHGGLGVAPVVETSGEMNAA